MLLRTLLLTLFLTAYLALHAKKENHIICIEDNAVALSEKEAILILPGLGDGKKQRTCQKEFFCAKGFDVYIPDYIDKDGFDATFNRFEAFHKEYKLDNYEKLHVFSYILGSWTINTFIAKNGSGNIQSIVYDRSPMQELAPELIVENIPFIAKMLFGKIPEDLAKMPYPAIDTTNINVGIVVESKATAILRHYEEKAKTKREFNWGAIDYNQAHDDLMYTYLNHDEMYTEVPVFGYFVLNFFKKGSFGPTARRAWYNWDSFKKLPKLKKKVVNFKSLKGVWTTEQYYSETKSDTVACHLDLKYTGSYYFETNADVPNFSGTKNGVQKARMDKHGTLIRLGDHQDVHTIQHLPIQDEKGRWYLVFDGMEFWKQE